MDDAKVEQVTDSEVFEVYVIVSVLRDDDRPLSAEDREEALGILELAVSDASDLTFTFIGSFGPVGNKEPEEIVDKEPAVEEVQAAIHAAVHDGDDDDIFVGIEELEKPTALASKKCVACHAATTQMAANQCPMCGNPFT